MSYPIRVRASALIIQNGAVLLIEYDDENGLHYNLPGGGVEAGEAVIQAVEREVREEAAATVEVGPLAFVYEYAPHRNAFKFGSTPSLHLIFACTLTNGSRPRMPDRPDLNQTAVRWVRLTDLDSIWLLPGLSSQIVEYAQHRSPRPLFFEEYRLSSAL